MASGEDIVNYMEYALERGRWWAAKHPQLYDDILATAMLALVKAFENGIPIYPKSYISSCIDNEVANLLNTMDIITIPRIEIWRRKKEKKTLDDLPKAYLAEDRRSEIPEELIGTTYHTTYNLWDIGQWQQEPPPWMLAHIKSILELLDLSEIEQYILELRAKNFTFDEIADELLKAKSTIHEILNSIRARYLRASENPHRCIRRPSGEA